MVWSGLNNKRGYAQERKTIDGEEQVVCDGRWRYEYWLLVYCYLNKR